MEELARLIDADPGSLEQRLQKALDDGAECVVARFTYWYTSRPPVHEAVILRDPAAVATA